MVFLHNIVELFGNLQLKITVDSKSDIDGSMLCNELLSLKSFLSNQCVVTSVFVLVLPKIATYKNYDYTCNGCWWGEEFFKDSVDKNIYGQQYPNIG